MLALWQALASVFGGRVTPTHGSDPSCCACQRPDTRAGSRGAGNAPRSHATEPPALEPTVTIPFSPDLLEVLARRVAQLLREQPPVLKTREWRDEHDVPYGYIGGRLAALAKRG